MAVRVLFARTQRRLMSSTPDKTIREWAKQSPPARRFPKKHSLQAHNVKPDDLTFDRGVLHEMEQSVGLWEDLHDIRGPGEDGEQSELDRMIALEDGESEQVERNDIRGLGENVEQSELDRMIALEDGESEQVDDDGDFEERVSGIQLAVRDYSDILEGDFDEDDTVTAGHLQLEDHRQTLHYHRLIEHEMPKLVAFRKPFTPPGPDVPLVVRSISYGGEPHPATAKRVITASVDDLPLTDADAVHRFKLLAGPRWTVRAPLDGGMIVLKTHSNGFIKISCESFPDPAMNLKWASDALSRLVTEANKQDRDKFKDVPVDLRHIFARARKAHRGDNARLGLHHRPSVHDFPDEWLPPASGPEDVRSI